MAKKSMLVVGDDLAQCDVGREIWRQPKNATSSRKRRKINSIFEPNDPMRVAIERAIELCSQIITQGVDDFFATILLHGDA